MADRRLNSFSIFRLPDHDTYMSDLVPEVNYGSLTNLTVGYTNANEKLRAILRTDIIKDINDPTKIPHFDNIIGVKLWLYCSARTATGGDPDVYAHELDTDITKEFKELGATWRHYKAKSSVRDAGCSWEDAGGDYADLELDGYKIDAASKWFSWRLQPWAKDQSLKDGDIISLLIKENEGTNDQVAFFYSSRESSSSGALPTSAMRGDLFGGGDVYLNGSQTALRLPLFEILYDDEVPEPITDFELVADENDPEKILLKFTGSSSEDVQGYILFATTDPSLYDFDPNQWGWVDAFTTGAGSEITCAGIGGSWDNTWDGGDYYALMTNGKKKGTAYEIDVMDNANEKFSIQEQLSADELGYNDMFGIFKAVPDTAEIFMVETNRGFFIPKEPDEDDFQIWIKDITAFTANTKYYFFVQAVDNLSIGPRGDKSNFHEFVQPLIPVGTDVKIVKVADDTVGADIDVYDEVYPVIYGVGARNEETTTPVGTDSTGLKGITRMDIESGEFRETLNTYTTTLTAQWSSGTTIDLDLSEIPPEFFRVGDKVAIVNRDTSPTYLYDIRTIVAVGDDQIEVDSAPNHTFPTDTTIVYRVDPWIYTKFGSLSNLVKARVVNEYGVGSGWRTLSADPPNVQDIPGIGALLAGPPDVEKDTTVVNFNMIGSLPKPVNVDIANYNLDLDDGSGVTQYSRPFQEHTYTSTGTKHPFCYIDDDQGIISPGLDMCMNYDDDAGGNKYTDDTVDSYDTGSGDVPLASVDDYLYLAFRRPISGIFIELGSAYTDANPVIEYYNIDTTWDALSITDNTADMSQDGTLLWDEPTDWGTNNANTISGGQVSDTQDLYFVRLSVTDAGSIAFGNISLICPLELGGNYAQVEVTEYTVIDLNDEAVLKDCHEKRSFRRVRDMYRKFGIKANVLKTGNLRPVGIEIEGFAHTVSANLLNGFNALGLPEFTGAANTESYQDDIQVIEYLIDNDYLVQIKDNKGTVHKGFLKSVSEPSTVPGEGNVVWRAVLEIDDNR